MAFLQRTRRKGTRRRLGPGRPSGGGAQDRLRSSWLPTIILLYSFCCSSLNVSFTFSRFRPPSLARARQGWGPSNSPRPPCPSPAVRPHTQGAGV